MKLDPNNPNDYEISQIMPASGWYARFKVTDAPDVYWPLVGWALVKMSNMNFVVGLDCASSNEVDLVDQTGDFKSYIHERNLPDSVKAEMKLT